LTVCANEEGSNRLRTIFFGRVVKSVLGVDIVDKLESSWFDINSRRRLVAGAILVEKEGLDCWRLFLLGSVVWRVLGIDLIDESRAGLNTEGFGGLDFEGFSEGNSLCKTLVGRIEFENGSKEGGNSGGPKGCCDLKAWKLWRSCGIFMTGLPGVWHGSESIIL